MSIKAMTWAFGLPLEPRAKLALLAIADNARDDGVAWPSRDTIAEKSSQSRSTVGRRIKTLVGLGVIALFERYREDGTQTTDEIRLDLSLTPADVLRKMHDAGEENEADGDEETGSGDPVPAGQEAGLGVDDAAHHDGGGGCQADTLGVQSRHPRVAVVTGGGLQSRHPQDEPSLEPSKNPPNPPDGGPLSKSDREANEKREALWQRFVQGYPEIARMDQQDARSEFNQLSVDDAEWAVSVLSQLRDLLAKPKAPPPKNAHIWLRKGMFRNFQRGKIDAPPPEGVWIVEGSDADLALRFARRLAKVPWPFVRLGPDGSRGYPHKTEVGPDLLAMLAFVNDVTLRWIGYPRGSPEFAAWQARFSAWIGRGLPTEPGTDCIRAPCQWPPKKDGTIYAENSDVTSSEGSAQ